MRVGMEDDLEIWKPEIKFTDRNEFGPDQDIGTAVSGPQFDRGGGGSIPKKRRRSNPIGQTPRNRMTGLYLPHRTSELLEL